MPSPPLRRALRARRRMRPDAAGGVAAAYALAGGSGNPRGLLDLDDRSLVGVEELILDLAPTTEGVDREQLRRDRELRGELLLHRGEHRAIALLGPDRLTGRRPLVLEECVRLRG